VDRKNNNNSSSRHHTTCARSASQTRGRRTVLTHLHTCMGPNR
jgi:hypothetical protein